MRVCLLKNNYISSVDLPNKIQGQYWLVDENNVNVLAIEAIDSKWVLKSNNLYFFRNDIIATVLNEDVIYALKSQNDKDIYVFVEKQRGTFKKYQINQKNTILTIGRNPDCSICIDDPQISFNHAYLIYDERHWKIKDYGSTNGTYVNNRLAKEQDLHFGDVIYLLGVKIVIGSNFISINQDRNIILGSDFSRLSFKEYKSTDDNESFEIDYFYKSPRIKRDIQINEISIDSPPENQIGEELPLMLVIGPAITMGIASLTSGIFAIANGNITTMIMSFSMVLGTVLWPIISKRYEKKRKQEKENLRQKKYNKYLDDKEKYISNVANEQITIWNENFPPISECIKMIENKDEKLFQRNIKHNDFLEVRLGLGRRKVELKINYMSKSFSLLEDNLKNRLYAICDNEKVIDNVPITISLFKHNYVGVVGENNAVFHLIKKMIVQLTAFYGYEDLKFVMLYDKNDKQYECLKWLPHCFDNERKYRYIARNISELKDLSNYFNGVINERKDLDENKLEKLTPYYIVFTFDDNLAKKASFIKKLGEQKNNIHFSVIQLSNEIKNLSNDCKTVITIHGRNGYYYSLENMTGEKTVFIPDADDVNLPLISKKLLNIDLDLSDDKTSLPNLVTFMQMYNVGKVEHLNALSRWQENDPTKSLEVPIGIDNIGELFNLDLHQNYHGPHGLVAGMTGSGKSEFIMTYILSLAINFHPNEVSFVLIDYKGGGMAKAFEKLPHTVGIITNLDGSSVNRSLVSIQSELQRRQKIFVDVGKKLNLTNIDIYKYQRLYRENKVDKPLSHLFIISDEFAELKTQQPDFMEKLVSAARIGRSLGIHLILATQKPSGVVNDQIWSNSRFKICLKVQDRSDSIEMIKRPEAAEISHTGRFYLQVGYNELFEIGQSAWAGAPYYPSDKPLVDKDDSVEVIDINAHNVISTKINKLGKKYPNANRQLDEITKYLCQIANEENILTNQLWLDPIPDTIYIDELINKYNYHAEKYLINPVIGEYDCPQNQTQNILTLPITKEGNVLLFGESGSGKTTFLSTLIYSLISQYSADEVQLYILDFASETLKSFEDAPHVGDVILSYEKEKMTSLFRMMNQLLKERKKEFSNYGGDIYSYNKESQNKAYSVAIIINNITSFLETYEDYDEILYLLTREGEKYGIYFIVSAISYNSVRYKLLQNFGQQICLQMSDEAEYSLIVGRNNGLVPADYKGRGLVKIGTNIFEYQTAYASQTLISFNELKQYCKQLSLDNNDHFAKKIPVLPDVITYDIISKYDKNEFLKYPIGMDEKTFEPYYFDFQSNYINTIVSQNTQFIDSLIQLIKTNGNVYVIDLEKKLEHLNNEWNNIFDKSKLIEMIDDLFEVLVERNNNYKHSTNITELTEGFENILIVLIGTKNILEKLEGETKEKLLLIFEMGKIEYKFNLIILDSSDNLENYCYSTWFKENVKNVIWNENGFGEQYIFNIYKKDSDIYSAIDKDFAYVLLNGDYQKIKLISF